ncbi:MAG: TQO small subunit DoxD [Nocardioidaceae bacterium]
MEDPPDFSSLRKFTNYAVDYPVVQPFTWLVEHLVLPNFTFFAWMTLLVEAFLGAFLLIGLATRLWAVIGIGQSLAITMSVLNAPDEWEWSYYLMILAHVALFATAAGRSFGLDEVMRPIWRASNGRLSRLLLRLS